ncbi:MAG: efflux RND transporter permease subunit [Saprospiraceae bacterium]|nr:efflux RND transporter permease subunit [Saprospiraceae bacterium]
MDTEVKHAAGKMMNSAVFGQIIILIVYLPIFILEGIEGKMFMPLAQTVAFSHDRRIYAICRHSL